MTQNHPPKRHLRLVDGGKPKDECNRVLIKENLKVVYEIIENPSTNFKNAALHHRLACEIAEKFPEAEWGETLKYFEVKMEEKYKKEQEAKQSKENDNEVRPNE